MIHLKGKPKCKECRIIKKSILKKSNELKPIHVDLSKVYGTPQEYYDFAHKDEKVVYRKDFEIKQQEFDFENAITIYEGELGTIDWNDLNKALEIYLTGKEIKEYMLSPKECAMCHYCLSAMTSDGYCPQYDCWATDKIKKLTDKQWDNIARKFKFTKVESIDVIDVWEEVKKKRVRK